MSELKIIEHPVSIITFGESSSYADGKLTLSREALCAAAQVGTTGRYGINVQLALPGESTRVIHVTDVIKPSYKETKAAFPGWSGPIDGCGAGITHQLQNLCITQCFAYQGIQEGIVDMSGPGAQYSIFSSMMNIVMTVSLLSNDTDKKDVATDLILMNTQAASYVASLAARDDGGTVCEYSGGKEESGLPRIGYAYFIQAQGPLRNVYVDGESCVKMKPRLLAADMILDGAIVSGNYIVACQKNPTYLHQENPVVFSALRRDGKELAFAGVIISTESSSLDEKRDNAKRIAALAKEQRMDGIIVSQEGGGHADVDLMLTCEACEAAGVRVVLLANEIAGPEGALPPLVSFSPKADAIVTTGNNDELVNLPAMKNALGGDMLFNKPAEDSFETPLGILYTATNQFGVSRMTTRQF